MPDSTLLNTSIFTGQYDGTPLEVVSTETSTIFVTGLEAIKTADLDVWAGEGYLTYTITITNTADYPYESVVFADTLDTTKIDLVEESVYMNAVKVDTYDYTAGRLSFNVGTIAVSDSVTITFQVQKNV